MDGAVFLATRRIRMGLDKRIGRFIVRVIEATQNQRLYGERRAVARLSVDMVRQAKDSRPFKLRGGMRNEAGIGKLLPVGFLLFR